MSVGNGHAGCQGVRAAAKILGLSTKTVRRYIAARDLEAVRLGRRTIRVRVDSLAQMIDVYPVNAWRERSA